MAAPPTQDLRANRSSVFASGTYKTGGGADHHLPIAESYSGLEMRGAVDFPKVDWSGVTELVSATLYLTSTSQDHVARGSSPGADVRRATAQWDPNGASDDGSGNWTTDPDVYPGPGSTSTGMVSITGRDGNGLTDSWRVDALVLAWAPSSVKGPTGASGSGAKQYGFALHPRDGSSRNAEWYSARYGTTGDRPRLVVVTKAAPVPAKPSLVAPLGPNADARTFRFTSDATLTKWDVDVATDSAFASPVWQPRNQTGGITGASVAAPYAGPALAPLTTHYWRAKGYNANGASSWSSTGTFTADPNPTGRDPWEEWAQAILDQQSTPRLVLRPGTVRPEGEQVAPLVTADLGARVRVDLSDMPSPFRSEAILVGMRVDVDVNGWTLTPTLGTLTPTAADWYGASEWYADRILSGKYAPVPTVYWGLGEPSGTFVGQVGGWGGTGSGTLTRGLPPIAGRDGAVRFDGAAWGAVISYSNIFSDPGASFTVLAWVLMTEGGDLYPLDKVKTATGGYSGWRVQVDNVGRPRIGVYAGAVSQAILGPTGAVPTGVPALVGWVRDTAGMRLYVNGERVFQNSGAPLTPLGDATMAMRSIAPVPGQTMDELGFWRYVALSDDQMRAIWRG